MKQAEIYRNLQEISEKFKIFVSEKNFRVTGLPVKSGFCKIKGENYILVDKHKKLREKNEILAKCLIEYPLDDIYIVPAIREYLEGFLKNRK